MNNNNKSCCELAIIALMIRAAKNSEASCNFNGHCDNELDRKWVPTNRSIRNGISTGRLRTCVGRGGKVQEYRTSQKGFQQKHRSEGILLQSGLGWTAQDQIQLRRARIKCPTVLVDVPVFQGYRWWDMVLPNGEKTTKPPNKVGEPTTRHTILLRGMHAWGLNSIWNKLQS